MHRLRSVIQSKHLISASPKASAYEAAVIMAEGHVGAIPILDDSRLVGIFSERDLMTRVVVPGLDPKGVRVSEVMTRDVVTAALDDTVDGCVERMHKSGFRHLPVVAEGRVISMLSMRDLQNDELAEQETEIQHLKAYLHQMPS